MDAAEVSPGEFAHKFVPAWKKRPFRTVIIDSLNGYQNAMPEETVY
jgi:circadian clock protein KaiC